MNSEKNISLLLLLRRKKILHLQILHDLQILHHLQISHHLLIEINLLKESLSTPTPRNSPHLPPRPGI